MTVLTPERLDELERLLAAYHASGGTYATAWSVETARQALSRALVTAAPDLIAAARRCAEA